MGGTIHVLAFANKDIASAEMIFNGKPAGVSGGTMRVTDKAPPGTDPRLAESFVGHPRILEGTFPVGNENRASVGTLLLHLRDTDGYENNRPQQYLVQIQPDLPPTVDLKTHGIGSRISTRAVVPTYVTAKDDHGISLVTITATFIRKETGSATSKPTSAAVEYPVPGPLGPIVVKNPKEDPNAKYPKEYINARPT